MGTTVGTTDTGPMLPPDLGIPNYACSIFLQDCPAGEKCMPLADSPTWNTYACVPVVPDPDGVGEPCVADGRGDSCELGAVCHWAGPMRGPGTCVFFCLGMPETGLFCDDAAFSCAFDSGPLAVCIPRCDPLGSGCALGEVCIYGWNSADFFSCVPASTGTPVGAGGACAGLDCAPGLQCVDARTVAGCEGPPGGCCSALCLLADPVPPCLPGQVCRPLRGDDGPRGAEGVGVCGLPD
ncbi:MAG: hypothetical protein K0V04_34060 [Deltaproteobacteria bacterium]|nr:hypothetical protein [Deltaproteobacteria bacterium]